MDNINDNLDDWKIEYEYDGLIEGTKIDDKFVSLLDLIKPNLDIPKTLAISLSQGDRIGVKFKELNIYLDWEVERKIIDIDEKSILFYLCIMGIEENESM